MLRVLWHSRLPDVERFYGRGLRQPTGRLHRAGVGSDQLHPTDFEDGVLPTIEITVGANRRVWP